MRGPLHWLRTLREVWDIARQLVELRDELQTIWETLQKVVDDVQRLDERTRKQRQRDEARDTTPPGPAHTQLGQVAGPVGGRADILRSAKAQGVIR